MHRKRIALMLAALLLPNLAQAQERLPVTVELGDVSLTKLSTIMAYDHGIFERNGLAVDMFITPRAAEAVREEGVIVPPKNIRSNVVADINIGGGSPTIVRMTTVAHTQHRVILATMDNVIRFHVLARRDITTPAQLKGKRIGFSSPGSLDHLAVLLLLKRNGIDPIRDVEMYEGAPSEGDIVNGRVDAMAGSELAIAAARRDGLTDLADMAQFNYPMPGSGVNALASWLAANHEAASRFMKASVEAIALMKTDRAAAYDSLTRWFGITDPEKLAAVYASAQRLPSKPYPSLDGLKLIKSLFPYRAMQVTRLETFADSSFVTALDRSGFIDALYKPKP